MPIRIHTNSGPADDGWLADGRQPPDGGLGAQVRAAIRELTIAYGPVPPLTALVHHASLDLRAAPGEAVRAAIEITNTQAAAVVISPGLSALVASDGSSWRADHHIHVRDRIVQSRGTTRLDLSILIDPEIGPGRYVGEVLLFGVGGRLPISLLVRHDPASDSPARTDGSDRDEPDR